MRKDVIAEWILELVMSRERATAAVGDLLEDSKGRDPAWFWTSIAWTVACTVWREAQVHGVRLALVASASFVLLIMLGLGANVAALVLWKILHFVRDHTGLELLLPGDALPLAVPPSIALCYLRLLLPFEMGRWTARHAQGRELSAWVVMMLLWPVLASVTKSPYDALWAAQFSLLGVIWERRRKNRTNRLTPG